MSLMFTMLESTCTLKRPNIGLDSQGGQTQDPFKILAENVPCSCQPSSTGEKLAYAQRNTTVSTRIYFAQNIGALINDVIDVADADGLVHSFQVQGLAQALFMRPMSPWFVDCEEFVNAPEQAGVLSP